MKKSNAYFDSADVLNSYASTTKPITWIVLITIVLCLTGLIVWSFLSKISYKVTGTATIQNGIVSLEIDENNLSEIKDGQVIYIGKEKGTIIDSEHLIVSDFSLEDGVYNYYIIVKEIRPIDFFRR